MMRTTTPRIERHRNLRRFFFDAEHSPESAPDRRELDRRSERSQHRTVGAGDRWASWDRFSGCAVEDAFTRWQNVRMGDPRPKPSRLHNRSNRRDHERAGLFSPVIFLFEGLWTSSRAAALLSQKIRTKAGEEPMLDAVMIAFLFLDALCVVIVLADEIRASLSRLRARGR
jgi:hypothetical protein